MRFSSIEILAFLAAYGLMCFGLGVISMQYRRLKESSDHAVKLVVELEEMKKQLGKDFDRKLAEAILDRANLPDGDSEPDAGNGGSAR